MTSQTLISKPLNQMSSSQSGSSEELAADVRVLKSVQTLYCSNHQEEFLDINAQIESLLAELRTLPTKP
jgi:hypothetical protein